MIQLSQLNYAYPKAQALFSGLNCRFSQGNIYGLLGRNGAGKTTLLKIVAGLLSSDEQAARILHQPSTRRLPDVLSECVYVPEEFYTPALTVNQHLKRFAAFYPRFDHSMLQEFIREFELPADADLSSFSYGMKKKYLIAFSLSTRARILLLDEPSNGLDIPSKSQLRKVLAGSLQDDQLMIISTHQVRDMKNLIDPVVILDGGRILLNSGLHELGQNLSVTQSKERPEGDNVLYVEETFGTFTAVLSGKGQGECPDLELLFNAVINRPDYFIEHYGKEA